MPANVRIDELEAATRAVCEAAPDVAVICLTASANLREVEALYEAGAVACLSKDQELDEIIGAIRRAVAARTT
jgi:DNA-binding NarL/FixJ family response regulator